MITEEKHVALIQQAQSLVTQLGFEGAVLQTAKEYYSQAQCKVELIDVCNQYCQHYAEDYWPLVPPLVLLAKSIEPSITVIQASHKIGYIDVLISECMSIAELNILVQIAEDVVGGDLAGVFYGKSIDRKLVLVDGSPNLQ